MNLTKTLSAAALGVLVSTGAFAQPYDGGGYGGRGGGLERRDQQNLMRIERGERTGQLTQREAWRLRQRQARIDEMQAHARADGRVTREEREQLQMAQEDLSRAIFRRRHNEQARY